MIRKLPVALPTLPLLAALLSVALPTPAGADTPQAQDPGMTQPPQEPANTSAESNRPQRQGRSGRILGERQPTPQNPPRESAHPTPQAVAVEPEKKPEPSATPAIQTPPSPALEQQKFDTEREARRKQMEQAQQQAEEAEHIRRTARHKEMLREQEEIIHQEELQRKQSRETR